MVELLLVSDGGIIVSIWWWNYGWYLWVEENIRALGKLTHKEYWLFIILINKDWLTVLYVEFEEIQAERVFYSDSPTMVFKFP